MKDIITSRAKTPEEVQEMLAFKARVRPYKNKKKHANKYACRKKFR